MNEAVIKYPFKFQDLTILELVKNFVNRNLVVKPVEFSEIDGTNHDREIQVGLGKEISRVGNFKIKDCKAFNQRDVEFADHLRFQNQLESSKCIKLKNALRAMKKELTTFKRDIELMDGNFKSTSIVSILEAYTGYENNIHSEYEVKSSLLKMWIQDYAIIDLGAEKVGEKLVKEVFLQAINNDLLTSTDEIVDVYRNWDEFEKELNSQADSRRLQPTTKTVLKSALEEFFSYKRDKKRDRDFISIFTVLNNSNYSMWIRVWVESLLVASRKMAKYYDLWNKCDYTMEGVCINNTGSTIPTWKTLARLEEDIDYFVTPEKGTSNWSIISVYPSRNPLPESDLAYWSHPSKFLTKVDSYEKAIKYISFVNEETKKKQIDLMYSDLKN